jgi:hypothetical protein
MWFLWGEAGRYRNPTGMGGQIMADTGESPRPALAALLADYQATEAELLASERRCDTYERLIEGWVELLGGPDVMWPFALNNPPFVPAGEFVVQIQEGVSGRYYWQCGCGRRGHGHQWWEQAVALARQHAVRHIDGSGT